MSVHWEQAYAERLSGMTTSAIRDILKVAQAPDIISMAGGWPEAALFPVEQFREICDYVLKELPQASLQYGVTDGYRPLRQAIAEQVQEQQGTPCALENVVITSGSQQGLDLVARIFLDKGDTVLVEEPTFLGALQSFTSYQCRYVTVPMDEEGICAERLGQAIISARPKFMYLLPTFQNPTGVTMSLARRRQVVEIAARHGVPIIEDDPYSALRFEGEPLPTLLQLDAARYPENAAAGRYERGDVIHMGTFSKTLAPGLRLAWAVCPPALADKFVMAKQGADLHSNALAQTMAYEFLRRGWMPAQVARIRETYRERAAAMRQAIDDYFPAGVQATHPEGGLFLWVTLPEGLDAVALLADAAVHKVAFVPGAPFYANGGGRNTLRLSYATMRPEVIREGIRRLGEVIRAHMG
jgi:2-aminoadipate transaminase